MYKWGGLGCAGEPCFLPQQFRTQRPISNPTEYTRLWVSEVAGQFQGGVCEVNLLLPWLTSILCPVSPTMSRDTSRPEDAR